MNFALHLLVLVSCLLVFPTSRRRSTHCATPSLSTLRTKIYLTLRQGHATRLGRGLMLVSNPIGQIVYGFCQSESPSTEVDKVQPMNSSCNSVLNAKPVAVMGGIRVVARIRPQQNSELEKDCIVSATGPDGDTSSQPTVVRIPSFKNENEAFSFQFSSVYDQASTQQAIFDNESRWLRTAGSGDFNLLMMLQLPPRSSISSMDST